MEFLIIGSVVMASVVIYKIGHTHGKTLGHTNGLNEAIRLQKNRKSVSKPNEQSRLLESKHASVLLIRKNLLGWGEFIHM